MSQTEANYPISIDSALLAELRRLEIRTRRSVDSDMLGDYRSAFRGTGLTFSDLREYQPGDDVRHIHWKATARSKVPYVKNYEEERQLRILLAIDTSASMNFGSPKSKAQRAIEFCALLSTLAYKSGDIFGITLFSSEIHQSLVPKGGRSQLQRVFLTLLSEEKNLNQKTSIDALSKHVIDCHRQSTLIFIISDFLMPDFEQQLRTLSTKHDLILVHLQDLLDFDLLAPVAPVDTTQVKAEGGTLRTLTELLKPRAKGILRLTDYETGKERAVDLSSSRVRRSLKALEEKRLGRLELLARNARADIIHITDSPLRPLQDLMSTRTRRY